MSVATLFAILATGAVQFLCNDDGGNDLLQLARKMNPQSKYGCSTISLGDAVSVSSPGDSILALGVGYPDTATVVSSAVQQQIKQKNLKVYVEFPDMGPIVNATLQRAVVSKDGIFDNLKSMDLLNTHAIPYISVTEPVTDTLLHFAKVAGYDAAVYGVPNTATPFLFTNNDILYTSAVISRFNTMRFAPTSKWPSVLKLILNFVNVPITKDLQCNPPVYPAYNPTAVLPTTAKKNAVTLGVNWYLSSGMITDQPRIMSSIKLKSQDNARLWFPLQNNSNKLTGKLGVFEGHASTINLQGRQPTGVNIRNDCNCETAMAFAALSVVDKNETLRAKSISTNILNYIWIHGGYSTSWMPSIGVNANGSWLGVMPWSSASSTTAHEMYKDENARGILAAISTSVFLNDNRWMTQIVAGVLGNLRWTGTNGFGPSHATFTEQTNWQAVYSNTYPPQYTPHYQSYIWALYLWGYKVSGYQPLYDRAYAAIKIMMENYPHNWIPTSNGITVQRARMILPLSWLVRVNDTNQTRGWLDLMITGLMTRQQPCGAFMEEVSAAGWKRATRVPNNDNYGTFEAPLNQENTDPVSDLLYTQNFALVGLQEAAQIDAKYKNAADKLGDFFTRVQARSVIHPDLDGAYFRAFDFTKWEVWASDADSGWGAWCTETGWIQSWVTTYLSIQIMNTSLWDLSTQPTMAERASVEFEEWLPVFFP